MGRLYLIEVIQYIPVYSIYEFIFLCSHSDERSLRAAR